MVVGLLLAIIRLARRSLPQPRLFLLVLAWFAVPLAAILIMRPTMYDNFRQFLFILPPLFVLSALAFEELFRRLRPIAFWALTLVVVAPGLLAMIGLHPYEYVYYNLLAGDRASLASRFENDYWVTSYREAVEFLNKTVLTETDVFVFGEGGPGQNIKHFGRPDLYLMQEQPFRARRPAYAVLTTRMDANESLFPDAPVIFQVERNGIIFAVVKHVR
jgi:hypothetical protein